MNSDSIVPHYQKVVDHITNSARHGYLQIGDKLPSLNMIAEEFKISRDTALASYKILKSRGLITAVPGKGYFLNSSNFDSEINVFILFDELNAFKEDLYNSIIDNLGENMITDIYFHHFNFDTFCQLVNSSAGKYSHYVIMPCQFEAVDTVLNILPQDKTFLLDQSTTELNKKYSSVYQNFEEDMYNGLVAGHSYIKKYENIVMIYPGGKEPIGQLIGFKKYCEDHDLSYKVVTNIYDTKISKNNLYLTPDDRVLVKIVKYCKKNDLVLGDDIGLISYNDTMLKEVVADGITTISTDFHKMGKNIAKFIKNKNKDKSNIHNPSSLIIRNSI